MFRCSENVPSQWSFLYSLVFSWERRPSRIAVAVAMGCGVLRRAARGTAGVLTSARPRPVRIGRTRRAGGDHRGYCAGGGGRPSEPCQPTRLPRRVQVAYWAASAAALQASALYAHLAPLSKGRCLRKLDLRRSI